MKTIFVTTLNKKLYDKYAHRLFSTYEKTNQKLPMYVFVEDNITQYPAIKGITVLDLFQHEPESKKFADRHQNQIKEYMAKNPNSKEFRYDAKRFSYKVFAQNAGRQYGDKMFFVDADIVFNKTIPQVFFEQALPDDCFISFFDRPNSYTETGFVGFDNTKKCADTFFKEYLNYYINDTIFELPGYLDCDVFDAAREKCKFQHGYKEKKLGDGGKAHIMARDKWFGEYFDHRKGNRKEQEHSPEWRKHNESR